RKPGEALRRQLATPRVAVAVHSPDAEDGERLDFERVRLRALRAGAARRRPYRPSRDAGRRLAGAGRSRRPAAAPRPRLVRTELQREAGCLAVWRERERLVVDG